MNLAQIIGDDDRFLCPIGAGESAPRHRLHPEAAEAYFRLQKRASEAGFALQPVSCHRSFDRQLLIWNGKARGERPVLDNAGQPLSREKVDDWTWVQAMLRWSALPGASRHHWGSDLDVYDAAAVAADYQISLTPDEVDEGGPFAAFHDWLDAQIASNQSEGFFRPYARDTGGVAPERWHLSYAPVAAECERQLSESALFQCLQARDDIELWPVVAEHWEDIYARFVQPPVSALAGEKIV